MPDDNNEAGQPRDNQIRRWRERRARVGRSRRSARVLFQSHDTCLANLPLDAFAALRVTVL